jgi:hypothetical protein
MATGWKSPCRPCFLGAGRPAQMRAGHSCGTGSFGLACPALCAYEGGRGPSSSMVAGKNFRLRTLTTGRSYPISFNDSSTIHDSFRSWRHSGRQLEKGKPIARSGRKAMGLPLGRSPGCRKLVVFPSLARLVLVRWPAEISECAPPFTCKRFDQADRATVLPGPTELVAAPLGRSRLSRLRWGRVSVGTADLSGLPGLATRRIWAALAS